MEYSHPHFSEGSPFSADIIGFFIFTRELSSTCRPDMWVITTAKGEVAVSQEEAGKRGILCHDDTVKMEWVGKWIKFCL